MLVPFATYTGGKWESAWPGIAEATGVKAMDEAPSIWRRQGKTVPRSWQVWPAAGGRPIQARVEGLGVVEAHCEKQLALLTDLPKPAERIRHPDKLGVAVDSAGLQLGQIAEVRRDDPLWTTVERAVLADFSRLEAAQAAASGTSLPRETPEPVTQIKVLYRETNSPRSPLYFVAERKYRTAPASDPRCGALTIITGWLLPTTTGTYVLVGHRVFLDNCDMKMSSTGHPLAAVRISDRLFWVVEEHGYEGESYVIVEITNKDVRYPFEVHGGGC